MKKKLTIDEQIEDLKKKGVTFEIMCEEDAKKFLRYNNYYFKLKSYAKNYPINPKNGKYVNLAWIIHGVAVKVAESHIVTIF